MDDKKLKVAEVKKALTEVRPELTPDTAAAQLKRSLWDFYPELQEHEVDALVALAEEVAQSEVVAEVVAVVPPPPPDPNASGIVADASSTSILD